LKPEFEETENFGAADIKGPKKKSESHIAISSVSFALILVCSHSNLFVENLKVIKALYVSK
jgi:hypothetical protein